MFAELDDEAEAAQVPAGQDRLRDGGHDGRGPGSWRPHPHTPTTGLSRLWCFSVTKAFTQIFHTEKV